MSRRAQEIQPSGIRKFFDLLGEMKDVVSLTVGQPDFVTPWHIRAAAIESLEAGKTYYTSNAGLPRLREEISRYLDRRFGLRYDPVTELLVTVGGSEAIDNTIRALVNPGEEVLIPEPSFVCYTPLTQMAGGVPVPLPTRVEDKFKLTPEALRAAITPRTKLLILPYPNNPTGALYPKEILEQIVQVARENDLILFADEIYDRLVMQGEPEHIALASLAPDLLTLCFNGLSKSHRVAGFRVGWVCLAGDKSHAKGYIEGLNLLAKMRLCSNVPAQSIIQTSLGGYQSVDEYLCPGGRLYEQRELIWKTLNSIPGLSAAKPKAAFYIFPKVDTKKFNIHSDEQMALDLLKEQKILITAGTGFNWGEPDHFRIVYLPDLVSLKEASVRLEKFFGSYRQKD